MIVAGLLQWLRKSILRAAGLKPMPKFSFCPHDAAEGSFGWQLGRKWCPVLVAITFLEAANGDSTPVHGGAACDRTLQVAGGQGGVSARTTPMRSSTILEYDSNRYI